MLCNIDKLPKRAALAMRITLRATLAMVLLFTASISAVAAKDETPILGVCEHLWGAPTDLIDRTIDAAAAANLKVIRWDTPWKAVEVEKGKLVVPPLWDYIVDRARSKGVQSLMILDYGNKHYDQADKPVSPEAIEAFSRYAEFLARHFAGRVPYFQIWNEWDGRTGNTTPGNARDYARLVSVVYPKIKAVAPDSIVITGSFDSSAYDSLVGYGNKKRTLDDFLSMRETAVTGDAVAIHPYVVYRNGPMRSYDGFAQLLTAAVKRIRATPGFERKPIFITELGWTTASAHERGVSESDQKDYIVRGIKLAKDLGVAAVMLYELRDENTNPRDPEGAFGLLRHDWSPKPVYQSLKR